MVTGLYIIQKIKENVDPTIFIDFVQLLAQAHLEDSEEETPL